MVIPAPQQSVEFPSDRLVQAETELEPESTVAAALVRHLADLGVEQAFGVSGGAIALFFDALADGPIALHHFRHETGAAFAAVEAHFASDHPTLVFTTTGPGILNALNGIMAARWDGAKVILVSGATNAAQRGRWATQESSTYTLPQDALYTQGPLFDFAVRMEHPSELPEVVRRLSLGLARPGGFVAHVSLPIGIQGTRVELGSRPTQATVAVPMVAPKDLRRCAELLNKGEFAVWVGFGARKAAGAVRQLVERTGARIFCSPRAKGVVSENHPQFLGVTGLGGHDTVIDYMVQRRPDWVLVLGTRLGEATSFWDNDLLPGEGFIHVDLDPEVPGTAYPQFPTIAVQAEIGHFLEALLPLVEERRNEDRGKFPAVCPEGGGKVLRMPTRRCWDEVPPQPVANDCGGGPTPVLTAPALPAAPGRVRPQVLMQAIQKCIIRGSNALVLAECGNSFAWCNHYLRFPTPERYRVSPGYRSRGHCVAGVVGAALARRGKAVAVVGDASMLMSSEISTAVKYEAPAVWIVLNDAGYGMCRDGQQALGLNCEETSIPRVDFVAYARSMGADGVRVEVETEVEAALRQALAAACPFVVDVRIDPDECSPLRKRFESLLAQKSSHTLRA